MEQTASQIKQKIQIAVKQIGEYLCWFLARSNEFLKDQIGQENYTKMRQFFQEHAFGCVFGSMVFTAFMFHFRFRKVARKELVSSSDNSKRDKSTSQKLPEKVKSKFKFASSDQQDGQMRRQEILTTQNYDSTLESKRQSKRAASKKKDRFHHEQDFEQILQRQVRKAQQKRVVLDDSKSDKIFNEMYGMYQQALKEQQ